MRSLASFAGGARRGLTVRARGREWYFSSENLRSDAFLRSRMDKRGFVPLPMLESFNRLAR